MSHVILARGALLGITAIGVAVSQAMLGKMAETQQAIRTLEDVKVYLLVALVFFCTSSAAALAHRYISADSMSWHLQSMRRYIRGSVKDVELADGDRLARLSRFKMSGRVLVVAAVSLVLGAVALATALILAIW